MTAAADIARRLRKARESRGFTRAQVAEFTGKHAMTIYRYEAGTSAPDMTTIEQLCRLYGVTLASIVDQRNARVRKAKAKRKRPRKRPALNIAS